MAIYIFVCLEGFSMPHSKLHSAILFNFYHVYHSYYSRYSYYIYFLVLFQAHAYVILFHWDSIYLAHILFFIDFIIGVVMLEVSQIIYF